MLGRRELDLLIPCFDEKTGLLVEEVEASEPDQIARRRSGHVLPGRLGREPGSQAEVQKRGRVS